MKKEKKKVCYDVLLSLRTEKFPLDKLLSLPKLTFTKNLNFILYIILEPCLKLSPFGKNISTFLGILVQKFLSFRCKLFKRKNKFVCKSDPAFEIVELFTSKDFQRKILLIQLINTQLFKIQNKSASHKKGLKIAILESFHICYYKMKNSWLWALLHKILFSSSF